MDKSGGSLPAASLSLDFPCFPPVPAVLRNVRLISEERVFNVIATYGDPYTVARAYDDVRSACKRKESPAKLLTDLRQLHEVLKESNDTLRYCRWLQKPATWSQFAELVPAAFADQVRLLAQSWFRDGREQLAHFRGKDLVVLSKQLEFIHQWNVASKDDPVPADAVQDFREFRTLLTQAIVMERQRLVSACVARLELASVMRASGVENSDVIYDVCVRLVEECGVQGQHLQERIATGRPRKPESKEIFDQLFAIVAQNGNATELNSLPFLRRCGKFLRLELSHPSLELASPAPHLVVLQDQSFDAPRCANLSSCITLKRGDILHLVATEQAWACVRTQESVNDDLLVPSHLLADCFAGPFKPGARLAQPPNVLLTIPPPPVVARLSVLRQRNVPLSPFEALLLWRSLQTVYNPDQSLKVLIAADRFQLEHKHLNLWIGHFGDAVGLLRSYLEGSALVSKWHTALASEAVVVTETWLKHLRSLIDVADTYHTYLFLELLLEGIESHLTRSAKEVDLLEKYLLPEKDLTSRWGDARRALTNLRRDHDMLLKRRRDSVFQQFVSLIDTRSVEYYHPPRTAVPNLTACLKSLQRHVTSDTYCCLSSVFIAPQRLAPAPQPTTSQFKTALGDVTGKQELTNCIKGALWSFLLPLRLVSEDFARQLDEPLLTAWLQARKSAAQHLCTVLVSRLSEPVTPQRLQEDPRLLEHVSAFQIECAQSDDVRRVIEARVANFTEASPDLERFLLAIAVPSLTAAYACKKLRLKWQQRDIVPNLFLQQVSSNELVQQQFIAVVREILGTLKPDDAANSDVLTHLVGAYSPQLVGPLREQLVERQQRELERLLDPARSPEDAREVQQWWNSLSFADEWRRKYERFVTARAGERWRPDVAFLVQELDETKQALYEYSFKWLESFLTDENFAQQYPNVHPLVYFSEQDLSYAKFAGDIVSLCGFYGHTLPKVEERIASFLTDSLEILQERRQLSVNTEGLVLVDVYLSEEHGLFNESRRRELQYQLTTVENIFKPAKAEVSASLVELSTFLNTRQYAKALALCQEKQRDLGAATEAHRRISCMFFHALVSTTRDVFPVTPFALRSAFIPPSAEQRNGFLAYLAALPQAAAETRLVAEEAQALILEARRSQSILVLELFHAQ